MLFTTIFSTIWALTTAEEHIFLRCAVSNATVSLDQNITQDCGNLYNAEKNSVSALPFCFVLFKHSPQTNEYKVHTSGCWVGGESECVRAAHSSDENGACHVLQRSSRSLLFCCCGDEMCNRNFKPLAPEIPPETFIEDVDLNRLLEDEKSFNETCRLVLYIIIPLLVLSVVIAVGWIGYRKCTVTKLPDRFGFNIDFKKNPSDNPALICLRSVTLVQLAARGRFGAVWRGYHRDLPVAVKIFPARERSSWENELEVYRLPQMQHPNVLQFIGAGHQVNVESGFVEYWLLTTWHELGSLSDYLSSNKITYSQLLHLSASITKGITFLHDEVDANLNEKFKPPMAHRDIKSKNIILKDDRTACIADFGCTLIFDSLVDVGEDHGQTGTIRYMAPEVIEGAISFDLDAFQRIDMYAVSLVLWEMLSQTLGFNPFPEYQLPFEDLVGKHPTLEDMHQAVVINKERPKILENWREDTKLNMFVSTIEDCWDSDADARLAACTIHQRVQCLLEVERAGEITESERSTATVLVETS